MDISKNWFVKDSSNNIPVKVLFHTKRIHIYKSVFKHGYRRIGFAIRKGTVIKEVYGSINLWTIQIGFSFS